MKRIIKSLILLAVLMVFPIKVLAAGNISASPSSLVIEVGSSKTFTITAVNTIGDVSISSSNSGIARVSASEWGTGMVDEGQTKAGTITVTGVSVGTATITLTLDAATFDGEDLAGQTRVVTVNVVPKQTPSQPTQPTQPSTPNNNNNNGNNNSSNNNQNNNQSNSLSTNNNLKEIKVDGHSLTKVDGNNYTLEVANNVENINISATAEDSKAKVTGTGSHKLQVGENNIEVIVTSESGAQNKINVKVTRKDGYYLEDLDSILKDDSIKDINIKLKKDSKITTKNLESIKNSKKIVTLNYYDNNKKLLYSWIINGKELKDSADFITTVSFTSEYADKIESLSNYADGMYIHSDQNVKLPAGVKLKVYVGDKYKNKDIINVYYYDKDKMVLVEDNIKVENGYITYDVSNSNDHFITKAKLENTEVVTNSKTTSPIKIVVTIIVIILVVSFIVFYVLKKKKFKSKADTII